MGVKAKEKRRYKAICVSVNSKLLLEFDSFLEDHQKRSSVIQDLMVAYIRSKSK